MGYVNDQYFRLRDAGETRIAGRNSRGNINIDADNPRFLYPDRTVREVEANGKLRETLLKRGYMRSLISQAGLQAIPIKKVAFQFNPTHLQQSVSQNPSMLNFLHQPPSQYAQPMPGNANFSFDLLFDRSMELNNAQDSGVFNEANPWEKSDPGRVGVLRDIAAFYSVIGQGMSEMQRDYIHETMKRTITSEAMARQRGGDEEAVGQAEEAHENIGEFLDFNIGNSAFLLPLPVRAVFSGLYIVEGLITDTTVAYTKFTTNYVPMQAGISITMEAKYIGFAKKDTFFTYALEQRAQEELREIKAERDADNAAIAAVARMLPSAQIEYEMASPSTSPTFAALFAVSGIDHRVKITSPRSSGVENKARHDPIYKLFVDGRNPTITVSGNINIYGPFDDDPADSAQGFQSLAVRDNIALSSVLAAGELNNDRAGRNSIISSTSDWEKFKKDGATGAVFSAPKGSAALAVPGDFSKYFIIKYEAAYAIDVDGKKYSAYNLRWSVTTGGSLGSTRPNTTISMQWPDQNTEDLVVDPVSGGSGGGGQVPADNTATNPVPTTNTQSNVGAPPGAV